MLETWSDFPDKLIILHSAKGFYSIQLLEKLPAYTQLTMQKKTWIIDLYFFHHEDFWK